MLLNLINFYQLFDIKKTIMKFPTILNFSLFSIGGNFWIQNLMVLLFGALQLLTKS